MISENKVLISCALTAQLICACFRLGNHPVFLYSFWTVKSKNVYCIWETTKKAVKNLFSTLKKLFSPNSLEFQLENR